MSPFRALRFPPVKHDAVLHLVVQSAPVRVAHRHHHTRVAGLEVAADTRDGAAGASAADEGAEVAVRLGIDFGASAVEVGEEVGGVLRAWRVRLDRV